MQTVYLALGANLGDRLAALRGARTALRETPGVRVTASSSLYETDPAGGPEGQERYLNAVLEIETELSPRDLLRLCLEVEERFGRTRRERWEARTLDVDLLLYEAEVRSSPDLTLPHPRLHQRPFVLLPLRDLAPAAVHPLLGQTVEELAEKAGGDGVRRLSPHW